VTPEDLVPVSVRYAAAWSWRILMIAAAVALLGWVAWQLRVVTFPMVVAGLLAALLAPTTWRLRDLGWPRGAAAGSVLAGFVVVVVGGLTVVGQQVSGQFGRVAAEAERAIEEIQVWLSTGPLQLSEQQISNLVDQITSAISANQDRLAAGALSTAGAAAEVFAGIAIALFSLFFFLFDGRSIWRWCLSLVPRSFRADADAAGQAAFSTLIAYVRSTVLVATFDGVFITIWLLILSVPLALPLGVLVFFGAFVPLVGAFVSGALAVLVAFVTQGPIVALLVLAGIVAVQQIEAHLFAPLVMGRMVKVHPLAIVLAISAGAVVFGIIGAIVAVPIVAVVHTVALYVAGRRNGDAPAEPPGEEGTPSPGGDPPASPQAVTTDESDGTPTGGGATGAERAPTEDRGEPEDVSASRDR
jgi:predicted PurR-regulated permease PerM